MTKELRRKSRRALKTLTKGPEGFRKKIKYIVPMDNWKIAGVVGERSEANGT
jgi:hypothetical protein